MLLDDPQDTLPERTLVENEEIAGRLADIRMRHQTLDEILLVLGPAICRNPKLYDCVPDTDPPLHRVIIEEGWAHPRLRIWFDYDDNHVYLVDIETTEGGR